jgi:hypothetical protein
MRGYKSSISPHGFCGVQRHLVLQTLEEDPLTSRMGSKVVGLGAIGRRGNGRELDRKFPHYHR